MGLRERIADLSKSAAQHEADEIRALSRQEGVTSVDTLRPRDLATVRGTIHSVEVPPASSVPAVVVEVFDGTGSVDLVFLGRRAVPGLVTGALLQASGRVGLGPRRRLRIYNPAYEIVPR